MTGAELRQVADGFATLFNMDDDNVRIATEAVFQGFPESVQRALICLLVGAGDCRLEPAARKTFVQWLIAVPTF